MKPDRKKLLGKRLRKLRKRNGLTLAQLAEKINIEPSSLGNIENGYNYPKVSTLESLSNAFGCDMRDFFTFGHFENNSDLLSEINLMLEQHPDKIQPIYKMLKGLFE